MSSEQAAARAPWTGNDALRLVGPVALGLVLCAAAWVVASGRPGVEDQASLAPLGVGGLMLVCYGELAWLLRGRRAIGERTRYLLGETPASRRQTLTERPGAADLVAGEGLVNFHRTDCPIARGHGWEPAGRATHEAAGRRPCGVCRA